MKKLFALALVSVSMMAFTVPPPEVPNVPAMKACGDGAVVMQDEDCPESVILRGQGDDGNIYRLRCPLEEQRIGMTGVRLVILPFFPFILPVPEFGIICDYGDCGTYPLEYLTGGGGPS